MNRCLQKNEIEFVFQHLELMMDIASIRKHFSYGDQTPQQSDSIIFLPHDGELNPGNLNEIPVLFISPHPKMYEIDDKGNLIFYQDLLKSAFYLLSRYDEHFVNTERDHWGRVKYENSIQARLQIMHRPLVNEYFDIILQGVNAYLSFHKKPVLGKKKIFDTFGLLLSHDIDVIDKFGWPHLGFKLKELFGLAKSEHSFPTLLKATLQSFFQFINPRRANPYWNFDYLTKLEEKYNLKASYYFLSRDRNGGSRYSFDEKRLTKLYKKLIENGHEVGIHGTTKTAGDHAKLKDEIVELQKASKQTINGGRQHRLLIHESTFKMHEAAGLQYDTSLGFAEHEGFRNSFCLPFKPYDFKNQKAIDVWQFPLILMDVTVFSYRKLNPDEVLASAELLLKSVKQHNGIFALLWHNSFFDEILFPGVTKTYESILQMMRENKAISLTGKSLTQQLDSLKNEH